ncbi:MAG: bifunctional DNA-formamidopyrimidine glycosylase/DNA-(apurinic or apyrimidinic site) lyase [Candidatus Gracilibacteria bacterium]
MPELPEVETIVRELRETAIGKKFWGLEGRVKSTFIPSFDVVKDQLLGLRILNVTRRGKFIVFELDRHMRLVIHLRMSGRLLWKKLYRKESHVRAVFVFSDATALYFCDARKFGRIWLAHKDEIDALTGMDRLGVEPLQDLDEDLFMKMLRGKRGILKNTLLRQDMIAGIGNIYADESCFRSGLHPQSRLEALRKEDKERLFEAIVHCLKEGIQHCGVSMTDFIGTRGELGKHQDYLKIYGRKGDPCYTCGTTIEKMVVAGRGTFVCPQCQKLRK